MDMLSFKKKRTRGTRCPFFFKERISWIYCLLKENPTMLLNGSETLYDSDVDLDSVPAKRGMNRAINDSGDDDIYILTGISNYNLQEQEHQNSQTEVNVLHASAKGKRMTHAEKTCEKE